MKTLIAALAFATIIAAPAFTQSANAGSNERFNAPESQAHGSYNGYPLKDWYRADDY
jgi:hypothetical protein